MTNTETCPWKVGYKKEKANVILYSLGKFISIFGTSTYTFAIGLYVLKITGSGLSFALTLTLGTIPMIIISPFAGVMADRFDKKSIVVTMDILNGILLIGLYFLSKTYGLSLKMIYASTLIMTIFTTFFGISLEAAKPNIVSEKMLMDINSWSKVIDSGSSILGPMVGGVIFAFVDIEFFIMANGVSFIMSGISELFIDFKYNHQEQIGTKVKVNFMKDIIEGFKYMIKRKNLMNMYRILIVLNFFLGFSFSVPLPFIINNVMKLSARAFGIIQGAFPVGLIIGALVVKKVIKRTSYERLLIMMSMVLALCFIMIGLPVLWITIEFSGVSYILYYCIVVFISGIAIAFIDIPILYILQKTIPDEYRGRVLSIGMSIVKTILPGALILSGILLNKLPSYILPILGGLGLFLFSIVVFNKNSFEDKEQVSDGS